MADAGGPSGISQRPTTATNLQTNGEVAKQEPLRFCENMEARAFIPKGSQVLKHGELFKIGRRTGKQIYRYFILRDNALFVYKSKDKVLPSRVISLKGMYVSAIESQGGYRKSI